MEASGNKRGDEKLPEDLRSVMSDFFKFQERYKYDHKAVQELKGIVESQAETIRLAREAEANEKQKAIHARLMVTQQQSIVDNFQQVMQENLSLIAENKSMKKINEDLLKQMKTEIDILEKKHELLKTTKSKEMEEIKQSSKQTVKDLQSDMELRQAEFEMKQQDMEEAYNALHGQKYEELNNATLMYEEKLMKFEENILVLNSEHEIKIKEYLSTISALKLRNSDLERKLIDMEKQRKAMSVNSTSSYRPPMGNQRQHLAAKMTPNYTREYNKPSWNQLQVDETRKSNFKPPPLAAEFQSIKLGAGGGSEKKAGESETKRRKLFVQQDDL